MTRTLHDGQLIRTTLIDGRPVEHANQGWLTAAQIERRMTANGATPIPGGWEVAGTNGHAYRWTVCSGGRDSLDVHATWLPANPEVVGA